MNTVTRSPELHVFELGTPLRDGQARLPSACLLAADVLSSNMDIGAIVGALVPSGCCYFMTWGQAAEELHDRLDDVIGERGWGHLGVLTAVHKREPAEDVAWFLVNAALPGEPKIRCWVGYSPEMDVAAAIVSAVRAAAQERQVGQLDSSREAN